VHRPATRREFFQQPGEFGRDGPGQGRKHAGHQPGVGLAAGGERTGLYRQASRGAHRAIQGVALHRVEGLARHHIGEFEHGLRAQADDLEAFGKYVTDAVHGIVLAGYGPAYVLRQCPYL
jgi:hypothetical protein